MIVTADSSEELRDLGAFLSGTQELRGCVRERSRPPGPQDMGPALEALEIVVGPTGVTAATASAVIAWLRSRRGSVRVTVHGHDERKLKWDATGVRGLDAAGVQQLTETLLQAVNSTDRNSPPPSA